LLCLEALEDRTLLSGNSLATALPLPFIADQAAAAGSLDQSPTYYALSVTEGGRLTAQVDPHGQHARLTLLSAEGGVLMQSDGQSPANPDDLIDMHVTGAPTGTTYYLGVQSLTSASGSYSLTVGFAAAVAPFAPVQMPSGPWNAIVADFNGDGVPDLATANVLESTVSVMLGRGDGTFTSPASYAVGFGPEQVLAADLNGDGHLDLVSVNIYSDTVSVLLGRGDGTFGAQSQFAAGLRPISVVACDWQGDGHTDLVVASIDTGRGGAASRPR
jgi:hypothetical protein